MNPGGSVFGGGQFVMDQGIRLDKTTRFCTLQYHGCFRCTPIADLSGKPQVHLGSAQRDALQSIQYEGAEQQYGSSNDKGNSTSIASRSGKFASSNDE